MKPTQATIPTTMVIPISTEGAKSVAASREPIASSRSRSPARGQEDDTLSPSGFGSFDVVDFVGEVGIGAGTDGQHGRVPFLEAV